MGLLLFYLFAALGISFLCSLLEAVLLSITPSYTAMLVQQGKPTGRLLNRLREDIDQPLSAILSLNTIAHTVGAAGVGAQAQLVYGSSSVGITSAILTLLILVLSEIFPKTLGVIHWRRLTGFVTLTIRVLIVLMYPFVLLSKGITKWLASGEAQPTISREEFSALADQGVEEGIFMEEESTIFKNLIRFSSLKVSDIMTPRPVVLKFHQEKTIEEVVGESGKGLPFSRLPVYGDHEEEIEGYVLKNEMLLRLSRDEGKTRLKEIKRELLIVPEFISLKALMERFLTRQEQIAAVVDEYGGFSGIVTMEDLVETLLGMEIVDEIDTIDDMQKLARQKWRERAKRLGISLPDEPDEESGEKKSEGRQDQQE